VVIRRDEDGNLWDFTNSVFSDHPALDYSAPTEDSNLLGMYLFQLVQDWTGLFQVFHYPSNAKTGKPLVLSINLTAGSQDGPYEGIAEAVRLEINENGLVPANVIQIDGHAVGGLGTTEDPWGPKVISESASPSTSISPSLSPSRSHSRSPSISPSLSPST
jgi:hypothetical protein